LLCVHICFSVTNSFWRTISVPKEGKDVRSSARAQVYCFEGLLRMSNAPLAVLLVLRTHPSLLGYLGVR
jgi:hypothetical protein